MSRFDFHLSTSNLQAFEAVSSALRHIEAYKTSRDRTELERAGSDLERAAEDKSYFAARYYRGIVEDLGGRSAAAAELLSSLLPEVHTSERAYVQYALALAYYHQYGRSDLLMAKCELDEMFRTSVDQTLKTAGHALLAQINAMYEIPKVPARNATDRLEVRIEIEPYWKTAAQEAQLVLRWAKDTRSIWHTANTTQAIWDEIAAMALNARGMANMYWWDYVENRSAQLHLLSDARTYLEKADNLVKQDWANVCDLASCHLRLGVFYSESATSTLADESFTEARRLLQHVVDVLRPDYGFALYEIGRSYRAQGHFQMALDYYKKSRDVPRKLRDVSDELLDAEMSSAENSISAFP